MKGEPSPTTTHPSLYIVQQEEGRLPLCPATSGPCLQPMRSHHHFDVSFSSNELLFKSTPPNFLLFSIKERTSALLSMICHNLLVPNCNSSAIPKWTHLLLNNFCCLIFKVGNCQIACPNLSNDTLQIWTSHYKVYPHWSPNINKY